MNINQFKNLIMNRITSRRNFIKAGSMAGISAMAITEIVTSAFAEAKVSKINIGQNQTILFQGDSITDAGRKKENMDANNPSALGSGLLVLNCCLNIRRKTLKFITKASAVTKFISWQNAGMPIVYS
jgi:hypothetical protein